MKERPILMSAPMVLAILNGTKTQTRRIIKPQPIPFGKSSYGGTRQGWVWKPTTLNRSWNDDDADPYNKGQLASTAIGFNSPYGQPGTILLVKEAAWMWCEKRPNGFTKKGRQKWHYVSMKEAPVIYCADHPERPQIDVVSPVTGNKWGWHKKIGRFLPKWAVRIRLESDGVRADHLNDISEDDAKAEGAKPIRYHDGNGGFQDHWRGAYTEAFRRIWEDINGPLTWGKNPWVWVITFRRICP